MTTGKSFDGKQQAGNPYMAFKASRRRFIGGVAASFFIGG